MTIAQYNVIMPGKQFKQVTRQSTLTPAIAASDNQQREQIAQEHPSREALDRWLQEETQRVASLSDEQVLAMADIMMPPEQDARMSGLLDKNREGQLKPGENEELDKLMRIYQDGMFKKASGWAEAVRRKLRESPFRNR